jgi:hypothetical protein
MRMQEDIGTWGVVLIGRLLEPPWHGEVWTVGGLSDATGLAIDEVMLVLVEDLGDRVRLDTMPTGTEDDRSILVELPLDPELEWLDRWARGELDATAGLPDPGLEGLA